MENRGALTAAKSTDAIAVCVQKTFADSRGGTEKLNNDISGSDALRGHTRSHPEHDG